jgi:hypothetical protein
LGRANRFNILQDEANGDELRNRFSGWELVSAVPVPSWEMRRYVRGPAPMKSVLAGGWFEPWRYKLLRIP